MQALPSLNTRPLQLGPLGGTPHPRYPTFGIYTPFRAHFICTIILQHSYLRNIAAFLQACKKHFNLQDLFVESDLYEVDNFKKVMQVLSRLSHSPEALSLGWV
jgi:hypothetical protein